MLKSSAPRLRDGVKKVNLSVEQYRQLVAYIKTGFQYDAQKQPITIKGEGYQYVVDKFYLGEGSYTLFSTCNDWINRALKKIGVKTAMWAPFAQCTMYHFE